MYPRVKRVRRGDQLHEYVQLVEGHRVDGKVRQRVVATLGRLDELKATGHVACWASGAAVAELLWVPAGLLNDDRLGRALEPFATVADDVRGRVLLTTLDRFDVDAGTLTGDSPV